VSVSVIVAGLFAPVLDVHHHEIRLALKAVLLLRDFPRPVPVLFRQVLAWGRVEVHLVKRVFAPGPLRPLHQFLKHGLDGVGAEAVGFDDTHVVVFFGLEMPRPPPDAAVGTAINDHLYNLE
jgi:hypothetical protein